MSCDHFGSRNYCGHHLIRRERDDSHLHSSEGQEEGEKKQLVCCFCHLPGNYNLGYPYVGFLYHCVECCNRPVHPFTEEHILKFTKSLENDGNKQVVCWGCDQPVLSAAYKCSELTQMQIRHSRFMRPAILPDKPPSTPRPYPFSPSARSMSLCCLSYISR
jgi:hypothetical protein